ncbi:hypothetical protein [Streptomyces sp. NPDC055632]
MTTLKILEGNILWEDKHVLGYWGDEKWLNDHIEGKFEKYLKARKHLPEYYADATIGFRFTRSNQDPRFIEAVEARFRKLRERYPNVNIQTKWY